MAKRQLEKLRVLIKEAVDLDVTYAYDDLVFPEHTAFLFRFDDADENHFFCHFHKDCIPEERRLISNKLSTVFGANESTVSFMEMFELEQKNEEVEIRFLKGNPDV